MSSIKDFIKNLDSKEFNTDYSIYPLLLESNDSAEKWQINNSQVLNNVHPNGSCLRANCVLHKPTNHIMKSWKLHYYENIFYRICQHNNFHFDIDSHKDLFYISVEKGCMYKYCKDCGCCSELY